MHEHTHHNITIHQTKYLFLLCEQWEGQFWKNHLNSDTMWRSVTQCDPIVTSLTARDATPRFPTEQKTAKNWSLDFPFLNSRGGLLKVFWFKGARAFLKMSASMRARRSSLTASTSTSYNESQALKWIRTTLWSSSLMATFGLVAFLHAVSI